MNADELLDRYVHEVGRNLPCAQRADVVAEIRSLLSDSLDARAAETGQPIDTAAAIDAVRAFGKPDEVAARYWTTRHLIGPDYFPAFVYVARIVLIFLAAIFLVGAVISFFSDELTVAEVARQLFKIVTQFVGYGLMNLGLLVVIFAAIERLAERGPEERQPAEPAPWDPLSLPAVVDPDRIKRPDLIAAIVFSLAFIVMLNVFPRLVTFACFTGEASGQWPLLTESFRQVHLPWFTLLWASHVVLHLIVLRAGRWRTATRSAELVVNSLGLVLVYRVIVGDAILAPAIFSAQVKFGLGIALIIGVVEVCAQLYRLLTRLAAGRELGNSLAITF